MRMAAREEMTSVRMMMRSPSEIVAAAGITDISQLKAKLTSTTMVMFRLVRQGGMMTAINMPEIGEYFTRDAAVAHLEAGRVVIFAAGTGRPFFSTDTAAALRAVEIGADAILMAKNIDGVYTADPKADPTAKKIDSITYAEMLSRELRVIDLTAAALCRDSSIPTLVFRLSDTEDILRAVAGETTGTVIS